MDQRSAMRVEPNDLRRMGEQRRYFPEWTPLDLEKYSELEADHNSYLAGGYAEEFGYRAEPGCSRGVPVLDGESAEQCPECHGQAWATHPGYPLRAHPLELQLEHTDEGIMTWMHEAFDLDRIEAIEMTSTRATHGTFVAVDERSYGHQRHEPARAAVIASRRFVAALVSLRWTLTRHS
jgi:hypothetical protein